MTDNNEEDKSSKLERDTVSEAQEELTALKQASLRFVIGLLVIVSSFALVDIFTVEQSNVIPQNQPPSKSDTTQAVDST